MKLLIDASLSPDWVSVLRSAGIESVHWFSVGSASASDREIMHFAQLHQYAVITHDLDFSAILFETGAERPSVVQIRSHDVNPTAVGALVIYEVNQRREEIMQGAIVTIDLKRTRLRVLPFRSSEE